MIDGFSNYCHVCEKFHAVEVCPTLKASVPVAGSVIRCDQVGCRNGEFDWPSSKGLCPKCAGKGTIPAKPTWSSTEKNA